MQSKKRIQNSKTQKSELKKKRIQKNNKTSTAVDVLFMIHPLSAWYTHWVHDTPTDLLKNTSECRNAFLDFWCKVVLINFNLMAKGANKKNLVNEETKGPKNLQ